MSSLRLAGIRGQAVCRDERGGKGPRGEDQIVECEEVEVGEKVAGGRGEERMMMAGRPV